VSEFRYPVRNDTVAALPIPAAPAHGLCEGLTQAVRVPEKPSSAYGDGSGLRGVALRLYSQRHLSRYVWRSCANSQRFRRKESRQVNWSQQSKRTMRDTRIGEIEIRTVASGLPQADLELHVEEHSLIGAQLGRQRTYRGLSDDP